VLEIKEGELKRVLLQEKKIMHKDVCLKPYSKAGCIGNRNTICKAIYNAMFEFIIYKIQKALNPSANEKLSSINLLDIFGFENFSDNSLEQLCINFTNEKLLKQYNKYVFENEMVILKEDGLEKEIENIRPPTNDDVIWLLSSELSLFSIINDNTPNAQFKDEDMISGFQRKFNKNKLMRFDLLKKNNFTIIHSQCEVTYNIDGFKFKNQDKINQDIEDIYKKLFENENKNQAGKTLLKKFEKEIEDLVTELSSASNHFVRCIKPNEEKKANTVDAIYMLTQVRYLGVFETIQIRQKTFPSRKLYPDFIKTFLPIFR
jgi:myosin heavy subunit